MDNTSGEKGMTENVVSVLVFNNFNKGSIRLPRIFNEIHQNTIMNDVILIANGGVQFRATYDKEVGMIRKVDKLMESLKLNWYNPLVLTYAGDDCFLVNVFSPCGIEIPNVTETHSSGYGVHGLQFNENEEGRDTKNKLDEKLILNNRALGLSRNSVYAYELKPIYLVIERNHVIGETVVVPLDDDLGSKFRGSVNEGQMHIKLGQLEFYMSFEWNEGSICFKRGWKKFITTTGIQVGDVLVLQPESDFLRLQACVVADIKGRMSKIEEINECRFLSIANTFSLKKGMIAVPFILNARMGKLISGISKCRLPNGSIAEITYEADYGAFMGLKSFYVQNAIEEDDVIMLDCSVTSEWSIDVFKKNGSGLVNSYSIVNDMKRRITEKRYSVRSSTSRSVARIAVEISQTLRQTAEQHVSGEEEMEEIVPMLQTDGEGSGSLAGLKSFEVILKPSHVDGHSHGVSLDTELASVYRRWGKKSTGKVYKANRMWEITLLRDSNRCRFSRGWNEFVDEAELEEGNILRYTLVEPTRKVFRVEVDKVEDS